MGVTKEHSGQTCLKLGSEETAENAGLTVT